MEKIENKQLGITLHTWEGKRKDEKVFLAKELMSEFGYTGGRNVLKRLELIDKQDFVKVEKKKFPEFFQQLSSNLVLGQRTGSVIMLYESGVNKLLLHSKTKKGVEIRNWLATEVLPSLRKTGTFSIKNFQPAELLTQTDRVIQLGNSKDINRKHYEENGVKGIVDYNRANCKQVAGLEPNQIKKIAGSKKSAKEILRKSHPELAATMSLNDHLVLKHKADLAQLKGLDESAKVLFKELTKLGFNIIEN